RMQGLACNVFLSDLTLEFDAVGVVLGHGFHPWKARRPRSIPNPRPVHRHGRTPVRANFKKPVPRTFHLENHMRAGKLTTVLLFGLIPYFNYWWNDRSPIFRHHIPPSNDHPS